MKFPDIEVLSNEEVNDIHSASLKILEEAGFKSGHQAVFVLDSGLPGPHPGTKQDVVNFTRMSNAVND